MNPLAKGLLLEFAQHGVNDHRLGQEELEVLISQEANGTISNKGKQKLKKHRKSNNEIRNRQSKDKPKSKKK